jgi:hypothetical protein
MTPRRPRPHLASRGLARPDAPAPEVWPLSEMDDPADRAAAARDLVAVVIRPDICHHTPRRRRLSRLNRHS